MVSFLFLACFFIMFQLFFPFYFAAATRLNSFTVVVLEDQAAEALRKAPDGAFLQTPSYLVQLSSHWTVVERNVFGRDSPDEEEKGGQMLHCRLPRPQTQEMVTSLEKSYMKFHQGRVSRPPPQLPLRGPGLPFTSPLSRSDVLDDGGRCAGRRIYLKNHEKKQQKAVGARSLSHGGTGCSARAYTLLPATSGRCCGGNSYRTQETRTRRTAFALLEELSALRGSH
ncbi:hypothetical protein BCY84_11227 [Trypanosoma cruzi cruzi]|nr:hypothetical protein BCY84_11221 [Trypanosoma cruzi cruzi]PBJ75397.1 hypothetical protein BCY84_11223 [Trypanosoma cruzi cruzi]PBJ75398.1 hypothetical protein BCY84_11225 [Trypanosoma cruzi cruzi]PBJ75400.1 hypothetical protein BCY84_11227 [Trypanosoma cruzi cruzi]